MTTAPSEPVTTPVLCDRDADVVPYLGAPCESCGHSTLLHPGPCNPELVACIACRLLDLALTVGLQMQPWGVELEARITALEAEVNPPTGDTDLSIAS